MARDVSNSFFFSSFLLLSSSKKNFYSFVRLFMDGSISTRSKKYEESRINTNAGGGGGDLVEIWDIFIDRRDGLKYRQMCNRWTVTLLFRIERRRDFSDSPRIINITRIFYVLIKRSSFVVSSRGERCTKFGI